jgi:3-phenylpropionate/trans-cinnamate dioxygenase ferredoxin reductase component
MPATKYLIIGGGMTAAAAMQGIREVDPTGKIDVISAESFTPYDRPPLTKALWKGEPLESIWRSLPKEGVTLHLGERVQSLDVQQRLVLDNTGVSYSYERLLLATGGTPRRLPFGGDDVIYYRTLADYERLRSLVDQGNYFAVIGGGFIGAEIAAALAMNGQKVTMIFPQAAIGGRIFPKELSQFLNDYYREKGVEVLAGDSVVNLQKDGGQTLLTLESGQSLVVNSVIAGIGIKPNTTLAQEAGLQVTDGIWVNERLQTSVDGVYAAGDVANFYNPALDRRLRVEHEDNANTMGTMAGKAMAGAAVTYHHLPFFYSDLFDLGYEAVGLLREDMEIVTDWREPNREGVIYYLEGGRVRGVLLWNVWEQVEAARALIAEPGPFDAEMLKGRLPS